MFIKPTSLINLRTCKVCDSKKIKKIFIREKFKLLKRNTYKFIFDNFICNKCNFIFAKKIPTLKFLNKYYLDYPSYFEKLEPQTALIRYRFLKNFSKNKKILLIGESDSEFIKKIKKKFSKTCISNINTLPKIRDKFDIILCYMVLEHVGNIKKFIKKIKKISNNKCKLFLGVPCSYRHFNSSFEGEHLNHFDKNNLKFFLQRHYGKVTFLKKTRNDDISVVSQNNKIVKKNILNNTSLYKHYLSNYNNLGNQYKKIISEIRKFDTVGLMPLNQIAIDILQKCKEKKFILFDKFKKVKSLEKGIDRERGGQLVNSWAMKFINIIIQNIWQSVKCCLLQNLDFKKKFFTLLKV